MRACHLVGHAPKLESSVCKAEGGLQQSVLQTEVKGQPLQRGEPLPAVSATPQPRGAHAPTLTL